MFKLKFASFSILFAGIAVCLNPMPAFANGPLPAVLNTGHTAWMLVSCALALVWIVEHTVGFRASEEEELTGLDYSQHGEVGYGHVHL